MLFNNKLHRLKQDASQFVVERYPNHEILRLEVESATNKIPFFNEILDKIKGRSKRRRLILSLGVICPTLALCT